MTRVSKRLSLHLRHAPERIGITLDSAGWVDVAVLLDALGRHGMVVSRAELDEVVARNDKRRFAFDATGTRIRASQGHSVSVDLDLAVVVPPDLLFHGTVERFLDSIFRDGLRPMSRHAVHLSDSVETATKVGARRGRPVVLRVDAAAMAADGHEFRRSANGVWLTDAVPPRYLSFADSRGRPVSPAKPDQTQSDPAQPDPTVSVAPVEPRRVKPSPDGSAGDGA